MPFAEGTGDDRAGAARAEQPQGGPDEVNEQGREVAHAQQRSGGPAEANRWKTDAFALQSAIRTRTLRRGRSRPRQPSPQVLKAPGVPFEYPDLLVRNIGPH